MGDSAGSEVAAAENSMEAQSRVAHSAGEEASLPNNKLVIRDKAHASRRILERPWIVDAFLMFIASVLILIPGSLAQIIQHSDELRQMYMECCEDCPDDEVSTAFNGMRAAKHRFETMCERLCRLQKVDRKHQIPDPRGTRTWS